MDDIRRKNHSIKMKARWKKCEKYAEILKRPKEEVWLNLDLINKYSKQLNVAMPYYIDLILREGKWKEKYNGEVMKEVDQQRYNEEKAEKVSSSNIQREPMEDLKLMFWVILIK